MDRRSSSSAGQALGNLQLDACDGGERLFCAGRTHVAPMVHESERNACGGRVSNAQRLHVRRVGRGLTHSGRKRHTRGQMSRYAGSLLACGLSRSCKDMIPARPGRYGGTPGADWTRPTTRTRDAHARWTPRWSALITGSCRVFWTRAEPTPEVRVLPRDGAVVRRWTRLRREVNPRRTPAAVCAAHAGSAWMATAVWRFGKPAAGSAKRGKWTVGTYVRRRLCGSPALGRRQRRRGGAATRRAARELTLARAFSWGVPSFISRNSICFRVQKELQRSENNASVLRILFSFFLSEKKKTRRQKKE